MLDVRSTLGQPEGGFPWREVLEWAPHLFWPVVVLTIFFIVGPAPIREAISRTTKIGIAGFEVEFRSELEKAAEGRHVDLSSSLCDRLVRRLQRLQPLLSAAHILWIDDEPSGNAREIRMLNGLGAAVDLARTDADAHQRLSGPSFKIERHFSARSRI